MYRDDSYGGGGGRATQRNNQYNFNSEMDEEDYFANMRPQKGKTKTFNTFLFLLIWDKK